MKREREREPSPRNLDVSVRNEIGMSSDSWPRHVPRDRERDRDREREREL